MTKITAEEEAQLLNEIMKAVRVFLNVLNEDELAGASKDSYTTVYNLLMSVCANFKNPNNQLVQDICDGLLAGAYEAYFQGKYLLEQDGYLSAESVAEVHEEFQATDDAEKHTFYIQEAGNSGQHSIYKMT